MVTLSGAKRIRCDCDTLIRATCNITEGLPLPNLGAGHTSGSLSTNFIEIDTCRRKSVGLEFSEPPCFGLLR